jgi:hypothetical protein
MMARFISRLVNTENQFHGENYQYDEFDEKSEKHNPIDIREADLSKKTFTHKVEISFLKIHNTTLNSECDRSTRLSVICRHWSAS